MSLDASLGANPDANNAPSSPSTSRNDSNDLGRPSDIPPYIARRAVEWLVELQSGYADTTSRQALQHWLGQHPDHERAWRHIEAVNGQLRSVASPLVSAIAHATLAPRRSVKRRKVIKTLAVLLFTGGTTWMTKDSTPWREWTADEHTGVGERRTVTLADGTTVTLNTASAISIRFSATERRVLLVSGEILVSTGKDTGHNGSSNGIGNGLSRPFLIETAQGELQPLGTRFVVRQQADASRVDIFEGAVDIRPHDGAGATRILHAGKQTRFTRNAINEPTVINDTDAAWIDGMLVASGMRLADFLAELSRHRPGRLSCDPAIAELRISGSYPLADTDRILDTLPTTLPVEIHFLTRYWVTVRPAHT